MQLRRLLMCMIVLGCASSTAIAYMIVPGTRSGVVIFDRWDGCILYSGVRFLYVSERVKHKLRLHAGQSVELDAHSVRPAGLIAGGPGLITGLDYVGPASNLDPGDWSSPNVAGLRLRAEPAFLDGDKPRLIFTIANETKAAREISAAALAFALLSKRVPEQLLALEPFDRPSRAVIAGQSVWLSHVLNSEGDSSIKHLQDDQIIREWRYAWHLDAHTIPPRSFMLEPGAAQSVTVQFELAEGEYDFLAGYGGGLLEHRGIASNLVAFDIDGTGAATLVHIDGR